MEHKLTKEEAIEILNNVAWLGTNEDRSKNEEAVAMAIQALELAPTIDAVEVVRCKDCKHWGTTRCGHWDGIWKTEADWFCADGETDDSVVKDSLTTKHGKWIEREVVTDNKAEVIGEWQSAKCSVCGKYHTTPYLYYFSHYDYCPHCGAKMEEVSEI